jgi:ribonuclease HII
VLPIHRRSFAPVREVLGLPAPGEETSAVQTEMFPAIAGVATQDT